VGLEERAGQLDLYVPETRAAAVARAVAAVPGVDVSEPEAVSEVDWSEAWKEGLDSVVISSRLMVSPWPGEGLWIQPGQAFGIGGHASTRLALEWIDLLAAELEAPRILDVGTGTGVLALAGLWRCGAGARAVACDVDALAAQAARDNARANGLEASLRVFTGTLAGLSDRLEGFDLVVANLLRTEMLPWLGEIARRTGPRGRVVLSGLLAEERSEMDAALADVGLRVRGERQVSDADGQRWIGLCAVCG
jgi:ribosomal protein L11 methyltransferase